MGNASPHSSYRPHAHASHLGSAPGVRVDRYHDGSQLRRAYSGQYQTSARLLVHRSRWIHAPWPDRRNRHPTQRGRHQRHSYLPARLHVYEPRRIRLDHCPASPQRNRRRTRRPQRPIFPSSRRSCPHADLPALARRNPAARRILGKIFHLPRPDLHRTLRPRLARRPLLRLRPLLLSEDRQRDVHGQSREGRRDSPHQPSYARGHRGCGHRNSLHWAPPQQLHRTGELDSRHNPHVKNVKLTNGPSPPPKKSGNAPDLTIISSNMKRRDFFKTAAVCTSASALPTALAQETHKENDPMHQIPLASSPGTRKGDMLYRTLGRTGEDVSAIG